MKEQLRGARESAPPGRRAVTAAHGGRAAERNGGGGKRRTGAGAASWLTSRDSPRWRGSAPRFRRRLAVVALDECYLEGNVVFAAIQDLAQPDECIARPAPMPVDVPALHMAAVRAIADGTSALRNIIPRRRRMSPEAATPERGGYRPLDPRDRDRRRLATGTRNFP